MVEVSRRIWRQAADYSARHPKRVAILAAALGGMLTFVYNLPGLWEFVGAELGLNYSYRVIVQPHTLRIGERASARLVRHYDKKDGAEDRDVTDFSCAWFYNPDLMAMEKGSECGPVTIVATRSDFERLHASRIVLTVSAAMYRRGQAVTPQARPTDPADKLVLLNEYLPSVRVSQPLLLPGQETDVAVEFPAGGAPSTPQCIWSVANGGGWSASAVFADPENCTTHFRAPRDADGLITVEARVIPWPHEPATTAQASLRVERPPSRYYLFVVDYTARMASEWSGTQTMFESMREQVDNAIGNIDALGGGFVGETAFGGSPAAASDECANIQSLYPLGPLAKDDAMRALDRLKPEGSRAPLAGAIVRAWQEYQPYRDANKERPADRFLFIVLTGGGNTCGNRDFISLLRDAMSPKELEGLYVGNKLLRIVLALDRDRDSSNLERLLQSPEYQEIGGRVPVVRVLTTDELNADLNALTQIGSHDPKAVAQGCTKLQDELLKQGNKNGATGLKRFCASSV